MQNNELAVEQVVAWETGVGSSKNLSCAKLQMSQKMVKVSLRRRATIPRSCSSRAAQAEWESLKIDTNRSDFANTRTSGPRALEIVASRTAMFAMFVKRIRKAGWPRNATEVIALHKICGFNFEVFAITQDWRDKSCWRRPRKSGQEVALGPGGVTTSPILLVPFLLWSQQNYLKLLLTVRYFESS